jgi:hypothetical protein
MAEEPSFPGMVVVITVGISILVVVVLASVLF